MKNLGKIRKFSIEKYILSRIPTELLFLKKQQNVEEQEMVLLSAV